MLDSPDPFEQIAGMPHWARIHLARTLGESREAGARVVLEALLADPEHRVQEEAARSLERLADPASIPALRRAIQDTCDEVRMRAAEALAVLGAEGIAHLIHAVRGADGEVNPHAVCELGKLRCAEAVPLLCELLSHPQAVLRAQVAQALGEIGSEQAVEPLTRALETTGGWERGMIAEAIRRAGHGGEGTRLVDSLGRASRGLCSWSILQLQKAGDRRAAWTLIELFLAEEEFRREGPSLRQLAASALLEMGEVAAQPLCLALRDNHLVIRNTAAWVLQRLGNATAALIEALGDRDPGVRVCAAEALGETGAAEAGPALCHALWDKEGSVRRAAARALGKLPNVDSIGPLCRAVRDLDLEVSEAAIEALREVGDTRAAPALIRVLQWETRVAEPAAAALAQIARRGGPTEALQELRPAIPLLRRRLSGWNFHSRATRQAYREALETLEAATGGVTDLPVPSAGSKASTHGLPRPAASGSPEAGPLPVPAAPPPPETRRWKWWSRQ